MVFERGDRRIIRGEKKKERVRKEVGEEEEEEEGLFLFSRFSVSNYFWLQDEERLQD